MAHAQRSRNLRLGVDLEANALIANHGVDAYSAACLRAQEASSEEMAQDWSDVANAVARKTRRRGSFMMAAVSRGAALSAQAGPV
ncbi:hypothetical protein [Rhodoblastus sp.]|uniref:hypothetical protein n=1 Tax=Rhodoblastus sp. TaxID=1962975 RepID=UPI003F9D9293